MLKSTNAEALRVFIDIYPVPMFISERSGPSRPFVIVCVNQTYEQQTGVLNSEIKGLRPTEIARGDEGFIIEARYARCVERREVMHYEEVIHLLDEGPSRWLTTIYRVPMSGGIDRIVGTALALEYVTPSVSAKYEPSTKVEKKRAPEKASDTGLVWAGSEGKVLRLAANSSPERRKQDSDG